MVRGREAVLTLAALSACFAKTFQVADDGPEAPDAGGGTDAGADAASEAGRADAGFCASQSPPPAFCRDFDEGAPASAGWTAFGESSDAATIAIDTETWTSPPASLALAVRAG